MERKSEERIYHLKLILQTYIYFSNLQNDHVYILWIFLILNWLIERLCLDSVYLILSGHGTEVGMATLQWTIKKLTDCCTLSDTSQSVLRCERFLLWLLTDGYINMIGLLIAFVYLLEAIFGIFPKFLLRCCFHFF